MDTESNCPHLRVIIEKDDVVKMRSGEQGHVFFGRQVVMLCRHCKERIEKTYWEPGRWFKAGGAFEIERVVAARDAAVVA